MAIKSFKSKRGVWKNASLFSFFILIVLAVIFLLLGKFIKFDEQAFMTYLRNIPLAVSGMIFVVFYVVATSLIWIGPKDVFRIVSAYVYGAWISTLLVWIAEMCNLVILFFLSRNLGRDYVESKMKGKWQKWDQATAQTNDWWIFVLRFFPIVPFRYLDLGMGLTKVSFKKYFLISLIATPARIFFVQYFVALGISTIKDPTRMAQILLENPVVFGVVSIYAILALVMVFFLGKSLKSASR